MGARILDAARRALAAMRPVRIAWGCAETNIGVNRRNGGALIGVPNEIMCELALNVRAQCGDLFFPGGYTNGCTGYLHTAEEYDRGGYEVFWSMLNYYMYFGRVMPLECDSAARLVQMAVQGLRG